MPILTNNKLRKFISHAVVIVGLFLMCSVTASAATPASRVVLVRTKTGTTVYAVVNNQRVPINSPSELAAKGYSWKNLKIISDKKMQAIPLAYNESQNNITENAGSTENIKNSINTDQTNKTALVGQTAPDPVPYQAQPVINDSYVRPSQIEIKEIGAFDSAGRLFAINSRGQVLLYGNKQPPFGNSQIILWDDGVSKVIPEAATPLALNNVGQVLFLSSLQSGGTALGFWDGNKSVLFKNIDSSLYNASVVYFGDDGIAYGKAYSGCGHAPEDSCVDYFKASSKELTILKGPVKKIDLPRSVTVTGVTQAYLKKVNLNKQGIGWAKYLVGNEEDYGQQSFFWNDGAITRLKGFNAVDINNQGEVVGSGQLGYQFFSNDEQNLFDQDVFNLLLPYGSVVYWKNGNAVNLSQIVMNKFGVYLEDVVGINDRGQIISAGMTPGGKMRSYYLINMPQEKNIPPSLDFTRVTRKLFFLESQNAEMKNWIGEFNKDAENNTYTIKWLGDSIASPYTVSFYYDNDNKGADGVPIVKGLAQSAGHTDGVYVWDASRVRAELSKKQRPWLPDVYVPECKYVYDDAVRRKNGAIIYSLLLTGDCHLYQDAYYIYAVLEDGLNPPQVVYTKTKIEL